MNLNQITVPSKDLNQSIPFYETLGLKLIVNPDEHVAPDQKESIADYAKNNNWLIVKVNDIPDPNFPLVSSSKYGKRLNKTRDYNQN